MADNDDATVTTAATAVTFRINHLVRLRGFNHIALDGKLVRIKKDIVEASGKFGVVFLDDHARPPVPVVPARQMMIAPEHFIHACEYCLVAASPTVDGGRLQMCGRCKTARYCNAACQGADWARHKTPDCFRFSNTRGEDTPLHKACAHGDVSEVQRLVEEEEVDVDKASTNGPTPLATAAFYGHLSVVRYLVEQGADVDKARATSTTPLYDAAGNGFLPIVQYLVEQGADKDKAANDGATPSYIAAANGHLVVVRYLAEHGADKDKAMDNGSTPMYIAAQQGHLTVVRCLVEQGADKDKASNKGATPLYIAAQNNHAVVVRYLVEQGADKDKARDSGATPLYIAAQQGHVDVVRYLVEHGADTD